MVQNFLFDFELKKKSVSYNISKKSICNISVLAQNFLKGVIWKKEKRNRILLIKIIRNSFEFFLARIIKYNKSKMLAPTCSIFHKSSYYKRYKSPKKRGNSQRYKHHKKYTVFYLVTDTENSTRNRSKIRKTNLVLSLMLRITSKSVSGFLPKFAWDNLLVSRT